MGQENRRASVRVACDLPVHLEGREGDFTVRMADVSRTGIRLRVPGDLLGVHRLASLAQVSRRLRQALGERFLADLNHEALGPLLRKELEPKRIGKRDWESNVVDVGCTILEGLSDAETEVLGLPVPARCDQEPRSPAARAGPRLCREAQPESRFTAWLYPEPGKSSPPLRTETRTLTRGMAILNVSPGQNWDLVDDDPVTHVVEALDEAYGVDVMLRVVQGRDDVWAGPARLQEVDVTPSNGEIRLGVAFGRELRSEELGRLGLPTPA